MYALTLLGMETTIQGEEKLYIQIKTHFFPILVTSSQEQYRIQFACTIKLIKD